MIVGEYGIAKIMSKSFERKVFVIITLYVLSWKSESKKCIEQRAKLTDFYIHSINENENSFVVYFNLIIST